MRRFIPTLNRKLYTPPRERQRIIGGTVTTVTRSRMYWDYNSKPYRRFTRIISISISLVVLVLLCFALLQAPWFRITNIELSGLKYTSIDEVSTFVRQELMKRRFLIFTNDNYFLVSGTSLAASVDRKFDLSVESATKSFPHTLHLELRERVAPFVIQTPEKYYAIDTNGNRVRDVSAPVSGQIVIADERADKTKPFTRELLEKLTLIKATWDERVRTVTLGVMHVTEDPGLMLLTTSQGFDLKIDPSKDPASWIDRLNLYLQDTAFEKPKQYIDLRIEKLYVN